jgi:AcrR family transcriptional regulator
MARPREFDEEEALDAAMSCFWRDGYEATSVRDLAARMGIAGASLYNAFGDKRALFRRALERYAERSTRERIQRLESTLPPKAAIRAFLGEMGDPRSIAYLLLPLAEVEIVDDWQTLGLAGTGSKSLVLHDVFVPEHRSVMVSDLFAGTPPGALVHPDYPVLRAPRGFLVSYSLPPVAIALGRIALDIACAALAGRVSRGVSRLAQSEVVQMALGEAAAGIDTATTLLHAGRDSSTEAVSSGRRITEAEALRARRDMVFAQHLVGSALDRLCELDGARWVYDDNRLGAIRRDVMTILTHHAASRQAAMAPYGKMLLAGEAG